MKRWQLFQSPDGDFVYSDPRAIRSTALWGIRFQSPDGDFVYSDVHFGVSLPVGVRLVSIP